MAKVFAISSGRSVILLDELVKFSDVETPKVLIIPHSQINEHDGEKKFMKQQRDLFIILELLKSIRRKILINGLGS